jgi:hypothetical protein
MSKGKAVDLRPGPAELVTAWRDRAASLRRYAPEVANALEDAASELEAHLRETEADLLTLQAATRETGYTSDHLGRLIRAGKLENHGRGHAPKVRRGDLPRKAARRVRLALQPTRAGQSPRMTGTSPSVRTPTRWTGSGCLEPSSTSWKDSAGA